MEILTIINAVLLLGVTFGVYKNKIDGIDKKEIENINARLIRLEEKVNYIYLNLKK